MKSELEIYKENNARQSSKIQTLKAQVKELEEIATSVTSVESQSGAYIYTLKRKNQELSERVSELEKHLRMLLVRREKAEQKAASLEKKLAEVTDKLSSSMNIDIKGQEDPLGFLVIKFPTLLKEHSLEKTRITLLEKALATQEMELKASRETIVNLVSEMKKEQRTAAGHTEQLAILKKEKDEAVLTKKTFERNNTILLERLKDKQIAWDNCCQELLHKEKKFTELDRALHASMYETKTTQTLYQTFISQLATLLSNTFITVAGTEEAIKERIQEICGSEHSWKSKTDELQQKILSLTNQLEKQRDLYHEALSKSYKAEEVLQKQKGSLKRVEKKLAAEDLLLEKFISERKKHMEFLQELTEKLQINQVSSPESLHCQYEMLLNKAEQLSKLDMEYLLENKNCIFNLQKKVNSQREKIKMKNWQIEQLTEKIKQFEKGKEQQVCLNAGQDPQSLKAQTETEKLQEQLSEMKMSNQTLQAKFVSVNDLKNKTIEELSKSLEKVEKIKEKAARKVVSLKTELDYTEHEARKEKERAHHMLEAVTNELHIAKRALEEVARREKQLVDFREAITKIMRFPINTLAISDKEIIRQLKQLIQAYDVSKVTSNSESKLSCGFTAGFENQYCVTVTSSSPNPLVLIQN
ncbi:coiled-coil domain-containing protein 170-like isoform X1 [Mauremys reevesii]|uniref:coiled-coil domain-containing protein 170-like isoform X1 n=3 Tax=Mauremys reevesii TaxID=260615 RepID=UPI00193F8619|nr:coiled-coil domain-containing protein 170-like isoform X1 [Mauremys reevesii]